MLNPRGFMNYFRSFAAATVLMTGSQLWAQTEVASPAADGPLSFEQYAYSADGRNFSSADLFVPVVDSLEPLPAVVLSGGYQNQKEMMSWLSERLASHGFIVMAFTPTNTQGDNRVFAAGHLAAVDALVDENEREGGALFGRIDLQSIGTVGFSMGGGGAHLAAQASELISSAVLLAPYQSERSPYNRKGNTLVLVGSNDGVAPATQHGLPLFQSLATDSKAYFEYRSLPHYAYTNFSFSFQRNKISKYAISWLKYYLAGDEAYAEWIFEGGDQLNTSEFSRRLYE